MMRAHLQLGLPDHLRPAAARLYWQVFGGKLGLVMGPEARALRYLEKAIRADHVIVALDDAGTLLGIAGFKTPEGSFAGGSLADFRSVYGRFGAAWRAQLLDWLSSEIDNERFLLDGLCVAAGVRSHGIGSALLQAICDEASARGYDQVRLEVIDTNWRARALYERLGFVRIKTERLGLLRFVFGFTAATTMVRRLK